MEYMKKIMILALIGLLLVPMVMADYSARENRRIMLEDSDWKPLGLDNALLVVSEENNTLVALRKLSEVYDDFRIQNRERLERCEDNCDFIVEEQDGKYSVMIQEKVELRLLGIPLGYRIAEEKLEFDNQGKIVREERNFWRNWQRLWSR